MTEEALSAAKDGTASFWRIFADYFGLAEWFKAQFKTHVKREVKTYEGFRTRLLWRDVIGPYYDGFYETEKKPLVFCGSTIKLKDVELTNFVPRSPGAFHSSGYRIFRKACSKSLERVLDPKELVENARRLNLDVVDRVTAEKKAVAAFGGFFTINDTKPPIMISLPRKGGIWWTFQFYSKNRFAVVRVNAFSGETVISEDTHRREIASRAHQRLTVSTRASQDFFRSGYDGVVRFCQHRGKHLLTAVPPKERGGCICPVELGFPVVMDKNAYDKVANLIDKYGSVSVDELTATLEMLPDCFRSGVESPSLEWSSGVPKVGLHVGSRLLLKSPGTPSEICASAWTAAKVGKKLLYEYRGFRLGSEDYEYKIKEAVDIINARLEQINASPEFDFDETRTRFSKARFSANYFLKRARL